MLPGGAFASRYCAAMHSSDASRRIRSRDPYPLAGAVCRQWPQALVLPFSKQADVVEVGVSYLRAISLTYVATAVIFSTASVFQGIGNTKPPFVSSALRVLTFAIPVVALARTHWFRLSHVWYLSAASIFLQALLNVLFLRRELRRRMSPAPEEHRQTLEFTLPGEPG